jgi:hypothetical protein
MNLPLTPASSLLTVYDLDLTRQGFARFLAREPADVEVGNMKSWVWNPLAVWIRHQVWKRTARQDWLVQVNKALVQVTGPTEDDAWHNCIGATPNWMREWWDYVYPRRSRTHFVTQRLAVRALAYLAD